MNRVDANWPGNEYPLGELHPNDSKLNISHGDTMKFWPPIFCLLISMSMTPVLTIAQSHANDSIPSETLVYEGSEGVGLGKHIVFIANDHEYRSEQSCPLMAKILAKRHGFKCTVLFGIDEAGNITAGAKNLPGLQALKDADLVFFFTRFMNLADEQADLLVDYFERGGPAVGVRTSTHCFNGQKGKWEKLNFNYQGNDYLGGLGEQVFGNTWHKQRGQSHYGTNHVLGCTVSPLDSAKTHPILRGVGPIHAYSGAYESQPPTDATPLIDVQVLKTFHTSDQVHPNKPIVNGGWTRDAYVAPSGAKKNGRIVYASFGASEDMLDEDCRRFFANACLWACGMEDKIKPDLDVNIVGKYAPTPFSTGCYYVEGVKPKDLAAWDSQVMPATAKMGGFDDPKFAGRIPAPLIHRPGLREKLAQHYPEIFGSDVELKKRPKKNKK